MNAQQVAATHFTPVQIEALREEVWAKMCEKRDQFPCLKESLETTKELRELYDAVCAKYEQIIGSEED